MLRPSYPGGVPYPPRPGEQAVRYVFPPGAGAGAGGPPPGAPYSARDAAAAAALSSAYARQGPPDVRSSADVRAGARLPLRNPSYPLYHGDFRDQVQVLSVGGRPEPGVHVVGGPPPGQASLSSQGLHAGLEPGPSMAPRDPKRPRMADLPPLRIETREAKPQEPGYHPQVEAISPTPEDNQRPERDDVRSTKEDLLQKISKVDREIAKAESQIAKLKKKQTELEDAANKPSTDSSSEENAPPQSLAQMVYSENRRKAEESHAALNKFSAKNALPLYNQPSDTEQYSNNKKSYTVFKKKLVEYFKKAQTEREQNDKNMLITYCKLSVRWNKKIDRIENSRKRKEREAKCREMYEKLFPELRKQREDKERDARLGTRGVVKSDADLDDVLERLQEQENEDKKMHSYAVIPPLLLPSDLIKRKFTNTNGLIPDPMVIYNDRKYFNMWTEPEKETFREKFLQHPKNFGAIAQYLERKTVADCVQYYYLSKKTENYKQLLRKSKSIRRPRQPRNPPQAPPPEVIGPPQSGIVTRNRATTKDEVANAKGSRSGTPNNVKNEENGDGDKETGKKKPDRGRDAKKTADTQNDSSDDEDSNQSVKSGPHPCVICKQIVDQSRAVSKSQASQLGLKEEDVGNGGEVRVCNKCWCTSLKRKHICPIPTCTSSKGRNRAKLRHLPSKWNDLDGKSKETIMSELQLPEGSKRVCTTCFTRITRRIAQLDSETGASGSADNVKKEKDEAVQWTDAEIEAAKNSLKSAGTSWSKMTEAVKTKTEKQCKEFFYSQRKRLQLDKLVAEYKKGRSDKPSLTSDEESGSTTSSCEDEPANNGDSTPADNKPATTDIKPPVAPEPVKAEPAAESLVKKEEGGYDSAATVSADETGDHVGKGVKPKPEPGQPDLSVNDLLEKVIDKTLQTHAPTLGTNIPTTSTVPSLDKMLEHAPPVPVKRNGNGNGGPADLSRPELEVRPVSSVPLDLGLDLRTPRPDSRASPASMSSYPDHFAYRGLNKPREEPRAESAGKEPPPAHGGADAKAKTTHNVMLQESTFPQMMRKEAKSPAPFTLHPVHTPGPVFREDPRKGLTVKSGGHSSSKVGCGSSGRAGGQGSILEGTPHPSLAASRAPAALGPAGPARIHTGQPPPGRPGSIMTGMPLTHALPKPISPRGPPQASGRVMDPYKSSSSLYHPGSRGEPSPSGTSPSSRSIIEGDYKMARSLPKVTEQVGPHRQEPGRRPPEVSYYPHQPQQPRNLGRGDPRADMPPSRDHHPRAELRAGPPLMDASGRPLYGHYPPSSQSRPGPSASSVIPVSRGGQGGSIVQGLPKQPAVDIYASRHPDVVITKQTQPPPRPEYGGLAELADLASNQRKMSAAAAAVSRADPHVINSRTLLDAKAYDARPKPDQMRGPPQPPVLGLSKEQEQFMSQLQKMSEHEKAAYLQSNKNNLNASLLIEAIITHQINKNTSGTTGPVPGPSRHSPHDVRDVRDGKESPSKMPSRSPSVKTSEQPGNDVGLVKTSPATVGEHIENMINNEVTRSSPAAGHDPALDHWKRRAYPDQRMVNDERQILRVAGPGQQAPGPDKRPPSRSSVHEAISPPTSLYPGQAYFSKQAAAAAAGAGGPSQAKPGYAAAFNDDYLKHKITEMMKGAGSGAGPSSGAPVFPADLAAKAMAMGPPHKRPLDLEQGHSRASPSDHNNPESPRKKYKAGDTDPSAADTMPDSPESGNMVIDETARPDSAHSHKSTASPAPPTSAQSGSSVPPPRSSPAPTPPGLARPPPANPRYEPLSDDD